MSDLSRDSQKYITGADDGMVYEINGVKFDGYDGSSLVDAKANYSNFVDKNGNFHNWFNGKNSLMNQAINQLDVANGMSIKWYFNDPVSMNAVQNLFNAEGIKGIEFILKPMS